MTYRGLQTRNRKLEIKDSRPDGSRGFTLIELILATAISALVMGILSVCLSFSLRAWESMQNRKPDQTALLIDLLKMQLAEYDPSAIKFNTGNRPLFTGDSTSMAFTTAHSVKALSQGVPVVARYLFDGKSGVLYYSELPFNPYNPKVIQEFLNAKISRGEKDRFRFYAMDLPELKLAYAGKDSKSFAESWQDENEIPVEVLLNWKSRDARTHSQILMVNTPFTVEIQRARMPSPTAGEAQDE